MGRGNDLNLCFHSCSFFVSSGDATRGQHCVFCFLPTRFIAKAGVCLSAETPRREKTKEQVPVVPLSNRAKRNCHKEWNPETETWNYAVTQKSASHTDTTDVIEELKQTVTPSGKEKKKRNDSRLRLRRAVHLLRNPNKNLPKSRRREPRRTPTRPNRRRSRPRRKLRRRNWSGACRCCPCAANR